MHVIPDAVSRDPPITSRRDLECLGPKRPRIMSAANQGLFLLFVKFFPFSSPPNHFWGPPFQLCRLYALTFPIPIMAIREELVTSAVSTPERMSQFMLTRRRCNVSKKQLFCNHPLTVAVLHDPSVSSSTVENRVSFLRSKNLTQEEIDVALQRAGGNPPPTSTPAYPGPSGPPQPYYQQFSPHAWQPPPPPRRDWRDWFIMATVAGGVGYGIYALGKVCEPSHQLNMCNTDLISAT